MSAEPIPRESARRGPAATLFAVLLVYLPYAHAFWFYLSGRELTVAQIMLFPLLIGGGEVLLIVLLVRHFFREPLGGLNRRPGRWPSDVTSGILLLVASFVLMIAHATLIAPLLPQRSGPPPQAVDALFRALRESRVLLVLWLGPVVWLGVAAFEELSRVFLLDRLWKLWPGARGRWSAILVSAVVFGLVHIYQGVSSVVGIGLLGLLYALYYARFGRVWPLIICHALFDSIQIVAAVLGGPDGAPPA